MHYSKVVLAYLTASAVAVSVPRDTASNKQLATRENMRRSLGLSNREVISSLLERDNDDNKGRGRGGNGRNGRNGRNGGKNNDNDKRDNDNDNDNNGNNNNFNDNDKRDEDDNKGRGRGGNGRNGRNGGKNNDNDKRDNDNDNDNNGNNNNFNDNDKRDEDDNKGQGRGRNGRNGGKNNNNDNDKRATKAAADAGTNGIFGTCSPAMDFQLGRGNRKPDEGTFLPTDPKVAQGQQDALNPNIITNRICDQLTNVCNASQEGKDKCLAAKKQIADLNKKDASVADAWNKALGV